MKIAVSDEESTGNMMQYYANSRSNDGSLKIEWKDIKFSILSKNKAKSTTFKTIYHERKILKGLFGSIKSGEMLAIMGPTVNCTIYLKLYILYIIRDVENRHF